MPRQPFDGQAWRAVEAEPRMVGRPRIMFMYWGRRGLSRFVRDLMEATPGTACAGACLSLSRQNDELADFADLGARLSLIDTFTASRGALTEAWRVPLLRLDLAARVRRGCTDVVIDLMPHVWSPFVVSAIQGAGGHYICLLHDAVSHPGDRSGIAMRLQRAAAYRADHVLALSRAVGERFLAASRLPAERLTVLFHPHLAFAGSVRPRGTPGTPVRLLFLGRIMAYKGLPLFLDTIDRLRAEGIPVAAGVHGEGPVAPYARRMAAMRVELVNRRLTDAEVGDALARYDVLVASHVEASQSGVVAAALGAGLPCVVTPMGGLVEQVADGATGIVATEVSAAALGAAVRRLLFTPDLYATVCRTIAEQRQRHSMSRFVQECAHVAAAVADGRPRHRPAGLPAP
jgi:glycosyltransferase involved in cell wall biosynthesis